MFSSLEYLTRLKQKEFFLNAEEQHLINEALAAQGMKQPFYYEALAALGRRLTDWGERLQTHYDATQQMPLELTPLKRGSHE